MTTWRHGVSWSKFRLALSCQLQLQKTIDKEPHQFSESSYYAQLGKLTQLAFELYFKQEFNLKPGGQKEQTIENLITKVTQSGYTTGLTMSYPAGKSLETLQQETGAHIRKGFELLKKHDIINRKVRAEVQWIAVFRGLKLFCMIDFIEYYRDGMGVFDGKGHARKNADPRQVLWYALAIAAAGNHIRRGGLLYWNPGIGELEPVDVSPKAIKDFIDGDFAKGRVIFDQLKTGIDHKLPASPSNENCFFCNWRNTCEHSAVKKAAIPTDLPDQLGFGAQVR